jgi:dipeptidyl aminopeptidase/acylaminoacyl peptidase
MSELDDRLRRDFLEVRERVERLPLPDITSREPPADRSRLLAVVSAALVVLLIAGAAVIAVRSRGDGADRVGTSSSLPGATASSSTPAPSDAAAHTVVFSDDGAVQQLNVDTSGAPSTLPLTWPPSLGGPDAQLALSAPAVDRTHTSIAFVVGNPRNPGAGAIAVANLDGSSARVLTNGPGDAAPAWSWDGSHLAFLRQGTVRIINADGTGERSLGSEASWVRWSPDGTTLAIQSVGEPVRIGVLTITTGHVRWLTPTDGSVEQFSVTWSPDGSSIVYGQRFAYASEPGGLFIADADGSNARRLTSCRQPCEDDGQPSWSSDGAAIAFVRWLVTTPRTPQVLVVAASGGAVRELTSGPQPHDSPSW